MISATMVVATVPVTDLDRAKEFYGGTLGLTHLWETPVAVRYRCGEASELRQIGAVEPLLGVGLADPERAAQQAAVEAAVADGDLHRGPAGGDRAKAVTARILEDRQGAVPGTAEQRQRNRASEPIDQRTTPSRLRGEV